MNKDLLLDLEPQQDDGGRWYITVCNENHDIAYAYFDTEQEGQDFIDAVVLMLNQNKG
jgi:hypothetical protein